MNENLITWNVPNFITVGIMAMVFLTVTGAIVAACSKMVGTLPGQPGNATNVKQASQ